MYILLLITFIIVLCTIVSSVIIIDCIASIEDSTSKENDSIKIPLNAVVVKQLHLEMFNAMRVQKIANVNSSFLSIVNSVNKCSQCLCIVWKFLKVMFTIRLKQYIVYHMMQFLILIKVIFTSSWNRSKYDSMISSIIETITKARNSTAHAYRTTSKRGTNFGCRDPPQGSCRPINKCVKVALLLASLIVTAGRTLALASLHSRANKSEYNTFNGFVISSKLNVNTEVIAQQDINIWSR